MGDKFKIPLSRPWITRKDREAVMRVLKSGRLALGPEAEALEAEFAKYHGYNYAVCVSSGAAALRILSRYHGAFPITGATFPGVELAVEGATELNQWVDKDSLRNDPVIVTALYDSDNIQPQAPLTQHAYADWCEAVGTVAPGMPDAAYSFYPNKQICGGEGGIICTQSVNRYRIYMASRNNGRLGGAWNGIQWGSNYRMDEMSAALIRSQLARLDEILWRRRDLYRAYCDRLAVNYGSTDEVPRSIFATIHTLDNQKQRDNVAAALTKNRIEYRLTFPPKPNCPLWQQFYDTSLMLPFYTMMPESEIATVCKAIKKAL